MAIKKTIANKSTVNKTAAAKSIANYKLIEGITSADYAYEITGNNLSELFENAALALTSAMVKLDTINPKTRKAINLKAATVDKLLYDFLDEVLFIKDTDNFLSAKVKAEVKLPSQKDKTYKVNAILFGEEIDQVKHKLGNDVKAITYHNFSVKQETGQKVNKKGEGKEKKENAKEKSDKSNYWVARVVLDV